jgi:hypothetical protein
VARLDIHTVKSSSSSQPCGFEESQLQLIEFAVSYQRVALIQPDDFI